MILKYMTKKHIEHVRHHAREHDKAHLRLKDLLKYAPPKEKVWHIFLGTFFTTLFSIIIFINWGVIIDFFTPEPPPQLPQVHGFQDGVLSVYQIENQATKIYQNYLAQISAEGGTAGIQASHIIGYTEEKKPEPPKANSLQNTIWLTNYISLGQHLTHLEQKQAQALQKSVMATYYLGNKTIEINSTLQSDSKILSQIKNALSVDLFQYLNQSNNRADSLDSYINLLTILMQKADQRIADLQSKINFLKNNFVVQENQIKTSEDAFFNNLKMFEGENADTELAKFIGLQEGNVAVRAKIGAYDNLQSYYKFFRPRLENLIRTIKANRDPLIAGVKVVEVQNMSLPLIIRQR